MASDRVNELYYGQILPKSTQDACRERIQWMCAQVEGDTVLDFGCSQGIASLLLGRAGCKVVGIDVDASVIEFARAELEKEPDFVRENVRFELVRPGPLDFEDGAFDTVLFGEVLEHLMLLEPVLSELRRVCKPGGRIVITTPFGVHPHPDHVRTYFLRNFVETVGTVFSIQDLLVHNKYICCRATNQPPGEAASDRLAPARLLALSEQAFEQAERAYLERWSKLKRQFHTRGEQVKDLEEKLAQLRQAQKDLQREHDALRKQFAAVKADLDEARVQTDRLRQSAIRFDECQREAAACYKNVVAHMTKAPADLELGMVAQRLQALASPGAGGPSPRDLLHKLPEILQQIVHQTQVALKVAHARHRREITQQQQVLAEQRADFEQRVGEQQAKVAQLQHRLEHQRSLIAYLRDSLALKDREVRYRIGDACVRACLHPRDFVVLPGRLCRLFVEGLQRRKERAQLDGQTGGNGTRPRPPVPAPALSASGPTRAAPAPRPCKAPAGPTSAALAATPATTARPAEQGEPTKAERVSFPVASLPDTRPRLSIKAGVIMDEFTYECFRPECHLVPFSTQTWKQVLSETRPDLLLVESTWRGNGGKWKLQYPDNPTLRELVAWCRSQNIPTVFWNKEDPPNFDRFIGSASLFDHIFTTDSHCISRYVERVGHQRVYALPFAAQPLIHNPIRSRGEKIENFCFAGTYYRLKYPERARFTDMLLRPAIRRGLHIYDRQHDFDRTDFYTFPEEFQPAIRASLPYLEMVTAYKHYRAFLNVNSVTESPTMLSRRVLELLACGTPVISSPAVAIDRLLGRDCVIVIESEEQAAEWMDRLLADPELGDRMVQIGQRRIFSEHTYEHRLRTILETIGRPCPAPRRRVSVVTCTNRPALLEQALENYQRQSYADKELLLVLNHDDYVLDDVRRRLESVPNARAIQVPASRSLGVCMNEALEHVSGDYLAKCDDDDYYGEHYLTDLMFAFGYTQADIVGKRCYHAFVEGAHCLALRFPGSEHKYTTLVSGATMIINMNVFKELKFDDRERGIDTQFQRVATDRGLKIYSGDRFNFVAHRGKLGEGHTWNISDEEFLEKTRTIAETTDFRSLAVV